MKTILITGATDGLGKSVALQLAQEGHRLLLHGRNPQRAEELIEEIKAKTGHTNVAYYNADFAELAQIKQLAYDIMEHETHLDVLVNNAGLGIEPTKRISKDGNEMLWQVNYLGTYILTKLLRPLLKASAPSRIIQVASAGQSAPNFDDINQELDWSGAQAYRQSKLAQIMLAVELSEEYMADGITINALHPASMMPTKIVQFPMDDLSEGTDSVVRLVTSKSLEDISGKYFFKKVQQKADAMAYDATARKKLLEISYEMSDL